VGDEMGLVHPKAELLPQPPVYKCGYRDSLNAIDESGCVHVPEGPGLGVEYDWGYITKHRKNVAVYS
jgi:L-alanine-DL-glutamate epimerase-like enolase superfamily enzyme